MILYVLASQNWVPKLKKIVNANVNEIIEKTQQSLMQGVYVHIEII